MDDPLLMRSFEGLRNLPGDAERLIDWNRSARDQLVEALAVDEFKFEELRVAGLFETVDLCDVRMVEQGEDLGFAAETGDALRIVRERGRQDLQRNVTSELRVLSAVDLAHAAAPDERDDFVGAEASARSESHAVSDWSRIIPSEGARSGSDVSRLGAIQVGPRHTREGVFDRACTLARRSTTVFRDGAASVSQMWRARRPSVPNLDRDPLRVVVFFPAAAARQRTDFVRLEKVGTVRQVQQHVDNIGHVRVDPSPSHPTRSRAYPLQRGTGCSGLLPNANASLETAAHDGCREFPRP